MTGWLEGLERAGDVHALAAREREALAGAMAEADLEVGDGQRLVDGGVGRDGDDHARLSLPLDGGGRPLSGGEGGPDRRIVYSSDGDRRRRNAAYAAPPPADASPPRLDTTRDGGVRFGSVTKEIPR